VPIPQAGSDPTEPFGTVSPTKGAVPTVNASSAGPFDGVGPVVRWLAVGVGLMFIVLSGLAAAAIFLMRRL
jgi:hypothetical protein